MLADTTTEKPARSGLSSDKRNQVEGTVYLLHFARGYGNPKHLKHHYTGFVPTTGTKEARLAEVKRRLEEHKAGRGNALVRAVAAAGIEISVAAIYAGTRNFERRLKSLGSGRALCPICWALDPLRLPVCIDEFGRRPEKDTSILLDTDLHTHTHIVNT